jgi:hypothetical protein
MDLLSETSQSEDDAEPSIVHKIITLRQELKILEDKWMFMSLEKIIDSDYMKCCKAYNINFDYDDNNEWELSYDHKTDNYNPLDYQYEEESEDEIDKINRIARKKESHVVIGRGDKYYIRGTPFSKLIKIYRNSAKQLRIVNRNYSSELSPSEQGELMMRYAYNHDLPESLAIKIFLVIIYTNLTDKQIIDHFTLSE